MDPKVIELMLQFGLGGLMILAFVYVIFPRMQKDHEAHISSLIDIRKDQADRFTASWGGVKEELSGIKSELKKQTAILEGKS